MEKLHRSEQELDQIREYERRLAAGLNPAPLVPKIDLETIAGTDNYRRALQLEELEQSSTSRLRGKEFVFHTPSRRLLWQAFGQEHIEPELLDFIDTLPTGSRYFDIGASNGIFALYAAATGKQVVCFEPEVANFALLNYNIYLNRMNHQYPVRHFNVAVSDVTELGDLYIKKFESGGHMKILDTPIQRGEKKFEPEFVQATLKYRLDDFLALTRIAAPNYIKIDVDGCELQVLNGMPNTLGNSALKKIFIELEEDGEYFTACENILRGFGFRIESRKRVQNYFGEENFIFSR